MADNITKGCMLSTSDNPYNPYTDYASWYAYDVAMGYNSCSYLARIAHVSDELSYEEELSTIEHAIDEIVEMNLTGNYIKVTKDSIIGQNKTDSAI